MLSFLTEKNLSFFHGHTAPRLTTTSASSTARDDDEFAAPTAPKQRNVQEHSSADAESPLSPITGPHPAFASPATFASYTGEKQVNISAKRQLSKSTGRIQKATHTAPNQRDVQQHSSADAESLLSPDTFFSCNQTAGEGTSPASRREATSQDQAASAEMMPPLPTSRKRRRADSGPAASTKRRKTVLVSTPVSGQTTRRVEDVFRRSHCRLSPIIPDSSESEG